MNAALDTGHREKNWVALTSLLAAIGITIFKLVVGAATGSLGILAEAAHSGLDLVAAAMTLWAIHSASRPPDSEHRYGHGKLENVSALFQSLLLVVTCVWIAYSAIHRLMHHGFDVEVNAWSFLVMATSIVVDWSRSRALRAASIKYNSQALEADALHFETDIWSSFAVIAGLICVVIGQRHESLRFLMHGDAVAALAVAFTAGYVTIRLGMRTVYALIDTTPPGLAEKVVAAAEAIPGIIDCHRVRLRTSGPQVFADIHVTMDGQTSLKRAHELTERVEQAIEGQIPGIDVSVHAEPAPAEGRA